MEILWPDSKAASKLWSLSFHPEKRLEAEGPRITGRFAESQSMGECLK